MTGEAVAPAVSPSSIVDSAVDVDEYVSGKAFSTRPGKVIQGFLPAHVRFCMSWLGPIAGIASCHASAVEGVLSSLISWVVAQLPFLQQPLDCVGCFPGVMLILTGMLKCLPLVYTFLVLPLLDWVLGEEEAQELGAPSTMWTYGIIFYVFTALHLTALVSTVYFSSLPETSALHMVLLCLNQSVAGGYAINVAHELTHHSNRADRLLGEVLLTSCCYKHWPYSHRAHHSQVATPNDPASAHYQESVYRFMLRCISGEWKDAVRLEMERMHKAFPTMSQMRKVLKSRIPGWIGWPLALAAAAQTLFGTPGLVAFLATSFGSVVMLTTVNYVEHYGLTRTRLPSGQYENVSIHHSWNANHLASNAALLRLQRHTDHHMRGSMPFYQLRNVKGAPRLPADYSTMMLAAWVPHLFFIIMNPRVQLYKLLAAGRTAKQPGDGTEPGMPTLRPCTS